MKLLTITFFLLTHFAYASEFPTDCSDVDKKICRSKMLDLLVLKKIHSPALKNFFKNVCTANDPLACLEIAVMDSLNKDKFTTDHLKALEKECNENDSFSCWGLAQTNIHGLSAPVALPKAYGLNEKACADKISLSCTDLGYLYQHDQKPNLEKALENFQKGCELKDSAGCYAQGTIYQMDAKKDPAKAEEHFRKSCDLQHPIGCRVIGAILYQKPEAREEALRLLVKSCALGEGFGCGIAGLHYNDPSPERSIEKAIQYLEMGCNLKDSGSCMQAGAMYAEGLTHQNEKIEKDIPKGVELLTKACDLNEAKACNYLSVRLSHNMPGYSHLEREEVYGKACVLGDENSCNRGGHVYKEKKQVNEANEACKKGNGDACYELASYFRHDREKNISLLIDGCNANHPKSCYQFGEGLVYEARMGIEKKWNTNKAKEVFKKACKADYKPACERAKQLR